MNLVGGLRRDAGPAIRDRRDQAFMRELDQRLANGSPTYLVAGDDLVLADRLALFVMARQHILTELLNELLAEAANQRIRSHKHSQKRGGSDLKQMRVAGTGKFL